MTPSASRSLAVRTALLVAVVGLVWLTSSAQAQPPGFQGGRPPGIPQPGFQGGNPGGIPQPPGFQGGNPGGIPQPPGFQGGRPPGMRTPPGIATPGTGMPPPAGGMPSGPMFENVWKCEKCQAVVGTGPTKPDLSRCPSCGVRFKNSKFGGGAWIGIGIAVVVGIVIAIGRAMKGG